MLCDVYRSSRKADTYVYLPHGEDFSELPDALVQNFGKAEKILTINLTTREQLARLSVKELTEHLASDGFYLQLPPKQEDISC
ncbi:YcgL domain-containing protein [Idiomarina sp.]|uniref:YcgL domain-containing protein n=1 Tax=Idiomarina sp. TaxID=1874361 RepID=UPI00263A12AE|nr:YcgL domain-containing protein [Idiomarina sp.]